MVLRLLRRSLDHFRFHGSGNYWERRYAKGGDSGQGSYGKFAAFKAEILNPFVRENKVESVIEFGCGDGNQLSLAEYPRYLGVDVSRTAVEHCRKRFAQDPSKSFVLSDEYNGEKAHLALSLDVIYHLIEDEIFFAYMQRLFGAATRFVILYCSNVPPDELALRNTARAAHVKHRDVRGFIQQSFPEWKLIQHLPNRYPYNWETGEGSFAEFFIYRR